MSPLYLLPAAVILALFVGCYNRQEWATGPVVFASCAVTLVAFIAAQLASRKKVVNR